jgi:hypothetical protein
LQLSYQGIQYNLVQIHFHTPSEHTFGGGYYDAEAHIVHQNPLNTKQYLVLGVMLQASASNISNSNNLFLNSIWNAGGSNILTGQQTNIEESSTYLNPYAQFLPPSTIHYVYNGSFTTPPCTQGVQWVVYDEVVQVSQDDIYLLRSAVKALKTNAVSLAGNNNRGVTFPLNGRTIFMSTGAEVDGVDNAVGDDNITEQAANNAIIVASVSFGFSVLLSVIVIILFIKLNELTVYINKLKNDADNSNIIGTTKNPAFELSRVNNSSDNKINYSA